MYLNTPYLVDLYSLAEHMPGNELSGDDDGLFLLRSDSLGLRRKRPSAFVEPLGRMGEFLNI